jgi:hypothetical protein
MEIILLLAVLLLVGVSAISVYYHQKNEFLEKLCEIERAEKEYYSKETLDKMEEIFYLRGKIAELIDTVKKLEK